MNLVTTFSVSTLIVLALSATGYSQSVSIKAIEWSTYWNSDRPSGQNDGWVWQGRGFTTEAGLAMHASVPFIKLNLRPSVLATQNLSFEPGGRVKPGIDLPDNPYPGPDVRFRFVESAAFLNLGNLGVGASNETRWWGPGVRNSIMLSNHAPGFDHVRVQTVKPQNVGIGKVYIEYIMGKLEGSKIRPERYPEGWRLFTGLHIWASTGILPDLRVGLNRTFIANQADVRTTRDYFPLFQPFQKNALGEGTDGSGSAPDDQRASVFFDWRFPVSGLRVYGEFAREDHNMDLRDALMEPGHIRAYQVGAELRSSERLTQVEFTQMQISTINPRGEAPWYTHTAVRRGYTHEGQVLGSGVGPGGNSAYISHRWLTSHGWIGGYAERAEREHEFAKRTFGPNAPKEVDFIFGVRHEQTIGRILISPELEIMETQNRGNVRGHTERNLALRLHLGVLF